MTVSKSVGRGGKKISRATLFDRLAASGIFAAFFVLGLPLALKALADWSGFRSEFVHANLVAGSIVLTGALIVSGACILWAGKPQKIAKGMRDVLPVVVIPIIIIGLGARRFDLFIMAHYLLLALSGVMAFCASRFVAK